ncbi:hypothetical protein CPB83DRAFT_694988 [Crepidotus variabilis]|uniref:Uncharacterized protein n=1 Tax=Crepidotus variabilis TaxID=179855 RepID=A0A9P6E663_9AGAR|nr:hypothetical protein CPB83DRAFT_694988 [Crepidotus variabilis]
MSSLQTQNANESSVHVLSHRNLWCAATPSLNFYYIDGFLIFATSGAALMKDLVSALLSDPYPFERKRVILSHVQVSQTSTQECLHSSQYFDEAFLTEAALNLTLRLRFKLEVSPLLDLADRASSKPLACDNLLDCYATPAWNERQLHPKS